MHNDKLINGFLEQLQALFPEIYADCSQSFELIQLMPNPIKYLILYQTMSPCLEALRDLNERFEKLSAVWKPLVTSEEYEKAVAELNEYDSVYRRCLCRNTDNVLTYVSIVNHMTAEMFRYTDCSEKDLRFDKLESSDSDSMVLVSGHVESYPTFEAVFLHYRKV